MYFVGHQALVLGPSLMTMIVVSLLPPRQVRRLAVAVFLGSLALLALTLVVGDEIKGARRWISLAGLSLQPSEFVKPAFAVVAAWMFSAHRLGEEIPGNVISVLLFGLVLSLLLAQPDIGQAAVVSTVWFSQWFLESGRATCWVRVWQVE